MLFVTGVRVNSGAVVSIVTTIDADGAEILFQESACFAVMVHRPSLNVGIAQLPVVLVAVKVQLTEVAPGRVAVIVTAVPVSSPATLMTGVGTFVMRSAFDWPLSEAVARAKPLGALAEAASGVNRKMTAPEPPLPPGRFPN
ncbi:unannotated protein [freshwater metagenome]|uniref:Unannotated protein n=1 Tax=freshwater metagenome TaxID=449393 RepID=A0A6J7BCS6_9ZZZZ